MNNYISINQYSPENYILIGTDINNMMDYGDDIITNMKSLSPDKFEGDKDSFTFELQYVPPFDKNFCELKRIQALAAKAAGRRSEFSGYIKINLSQWLSHHEEEYLRKTLLFLIDMSDYWKYIFFVDNYNAKNTKELVGKVLTLFYRDNLTCMVIEDDKQTSIKMSVNNVCKAHGVVCSPQAKELLEELLEEGFDENIISAFISQLSWSEGKQISMKAINNYISNYESIIRYMLSKKDNERFMTIIENRKDFLNGEKEAV